MTTSFTIGNGEFGPRAILKSEWQPGTEKLLLKNEIVELELNDAKGWHGNDILFLKLLPNLKAFTIIDLKISSVEPIHYLHELRKLEVITYCQTNIDSKSFPMLEDCALEWRSGASSLFACKTLRSFYVNRYNGKDTKNFSSLTNLENLSILNSTIESLRGIGNLKRLRALRLGNLKRLSSLSGINELINLEELDIQKCKKIDSLEDLGQMPRLKKIFLNDMGTINSFAPLAKIETLESVLFYGSTNVVDGDISPLMSLKHLSKISFQNRRHYSHRREDFGAAWGNRCDLSI
jgi:hypothetical protein